MDKNTNTPKNPLIGSALALIIGTSLMATSAQAETQVRLQSSNNAAAFSEGYALSVEDWSAQTKSARSNRSAGFRHHSQSRPQVWIGDIGTLLFDDFDGDGYHSGFSVTIDVDSEYGDTEVYAKIYLEPSNASAVLLHKTGRFSIYGSTIGDEYRVDTELRNNYLADDYNVTIDIHDAWSDQLLDTANARGFNNLKKLPLESSELNQPTYEDDDYDDGQHEQSNDVVVTEYAASFHPIWLMLLAGGALLRSRKR